MNTCNTVIDKICNNLGCSFRAKLSVIYCIPRVAVAKNAILALGCRWIDLSGHKTNNEKSRL